jgi:hypothetical protein
MKIMAILMTVGKEGASKTLWHNIGTITDSQEAFCNVCAPWFNISSDVDIVDVVQKFFHLTRMQDIMHIEEDKMYVVHVSGNWHSAETNTKLLLQQPPPCVKCFVP